MARASPGTCAVCNSPTTITEPREDWLAVDGCACQGFFISRWLWAGWLRKMGKQDRETLGAQIQLWRASGRDAWIFREPKGRIVISSACPSSRV
jgi:hypothetical protein